MKIYLDIDGVIVGRGRTPAPFVVEFLNAVSKHDCYWATTHCKGDGDTALRYVKDILPKQAYSYCEKIKSTDWSHHKTEIFDMSSNFLWFEDVPFEFEKEILQKNGKLNSLVIVDLVNNPNHLKDLIKLL